MKTVSDLARALEKGVQASWGLGEQPEEPGAPSSAVGAHLRGGKDGVLVEAEHGICDDVVVGQKTAAHHLGGRRKKAGGKKLGKRATFQSCFQDNSPILSLQKECSTTMSPLNIEGFHFSSVQIHRFRSFGHLLCPHVLLVKGSTR